MVWCGKRRGVRSVFLVLVGRVCFGYFPPFGSVVSYGLYNAHTDTHKATSEQARVARPARHAPAETQMRVRPVMSGVAGKQTTTTARPRAKHSREKAAIFVGLYSLVEWWWGGGGLGLSICR